MTPEFLRLYNEELAYMRDMGAEFARAYPKIAGRLGMESSEVADPYVERLLEGFAFLAARVQLKLQARFPDFTQHLLELVYPHFLAPIPSMSVVEFEPDAETGRMERGALVPRDTRLISEVVPGTITACEFRTARDVHLWPIEVKALEYFQAASQISSLDLPLRKQIRAVIRLRLRTTNGVTFGKLALNSLNLHFPSDGGIGGALLQRLMADCCGIVVRPVDRPVPWQEILQPGCLRQTFDAAEEALLPPMPRAFEGYRLLQEYFTLPERVLFAELTGLGDAIQSSESGEIEILFALDRAEPKLERQLGKRSVRLFATPAINLFERRTDPIRIDDSRPDHHVVIDRVRPMDLELHSLLEVAGERSNGERIAFRPFYSISGTPGENATAGCYTLRREARLPSSTVQLEGARTGYLGSEAFLALGEPGTPMTDPELRQLSLRCLCSNRDLPMLLVPGDGESDFALEIGAPVRSVRCLTQPTPPRPSAAEGDVAWKLISHLSLNYLSITDTEAGAGADALRELLSLYAGTDSPGRAKQVAGVVSVQTAPVIRRLPAGGQAAIARGIEVTLGLDEAAYEGIGIFPLASVLARFFARHVSINSFTETVLTTQTQGEAMRWPVMIGRQATL
ncbi:type VI secretion system baseplate subunit TssF [Thalassococcus sp. S3]|uniref:type VI secretion system baseplate subunit TssF n=1 Tax=Thalassococcus sp. S3 TaxID=2017482 RepID=UPI0010240A39|nr:type VI secretion system baseplate subunit TssF [Thalassococcus sp. S3]QBF33989.1 type VI secretion system ImpG/VasA family protein [Thalassococcus sp. S3]